MLKINQSATFRWPVTVMVPVDGGKFEPATFEVEFPRMPQSEVLALIKSVQDGSVGEAEGIVQVVRGWSGVEGPDGPVPFEERALRDLLERFPTAGAEILRAFADARGELARRKN